MLKELVSSLYSLLQLLEIHCDPRKDYITMDFISNSGGNHLQEEIQAVTPVVPPLVSHLVTGELQVLTD